MTWWRTLVLLAVLRAAIPLLVLAASGTKLPLLPAYEWRPLRGDAPGYLTTAYALQDGWRELGAAAVAASLIAVGVVAAALPFAWRRGEWWRAGGSALLVAAVALAFATAIGEMPKALSGAVGWPLLWSLPLAPLRAAGLDSEGWAYAAAVALSLAAHAVAVVAVAYAGLYASGRRAVGLVAGALYAAWPIASPLLGGSTTASNDQWAVEVGLHGFSEPVSTACVAVGTALVLSPALTPGRLVGAGVALGYAVAVRPPNVLIVVLALVFVLARSGVRNVAAFALGAAAVLPIVVAFLPKRSGYELLTSDASGALFSHEYLVDSFRDSHFWHWRTLAVLVPLAVAGAILLRRPLVAAFLAVSVVSIALFYASFRHTAEHPRYLLAALPALIVLIAAALTKLAVRTS